MVKACYFLFFSLSIVIVFVGVYSQWGRRYINSNSGDWSILPGIGRVYGNSEDKYFLVDNASGTSMWVEPDRLVEYDPEKYTITYFPAQNSFLGYVVGYFVGWEDISETSDKYILIREGVGGEILKYRVNYDLNTSTYWAETSLQVERVGVFGEKQRMSRSVISFADTGHNKIARAFKVGDVIAIIPLIKDGDLDVKDTSGNVIADTVIARRSFGLVELKHEINK